MHWKGSLLQTTREMVREILAILMTAPLQNLLNALKLVALEKVAFRDTEISKAVC